MILAQALVVDKKESFVFDDWAAEGHTVLAETEGWDGGISIDIKIVEVAGVENGIAKITKDRSVQIVGARLGYDVDLTAGLRAVFGRV